MINTIEKQRVMALPKYVPDNKTPWNAKRVLHLYRRAGFGANPLIVAEGLKKTPEELVDYLVDEALIREPVRLEWADATEEEAVATKEARLRQMKELRQAVVYEFYTDNLSNRMVMFWSNHFTLSYLTGRRSHILHQYYDLLHNEGLGDFKKLTREIGLNGIMLMYLDGINNKKGKPNENYARELYELFTLGIDNGYTETDIKQTARALTGYTELGRTYAAFNPKDHDNGEKTIFGQTGNWGYHDVIDILFEQRGDRIAKYICTKLFIEFVSPNFENNAAKNTINSLKETFLANDFQIAPVMRALFKSQIFFDNKRIGVHFKSPIEVVVMFHKETNFKYPNKTYGNMYKTLASTCTGAGQTIFNPPDVAGWPGNRDWIAPSPLTVRWNLLGKFIEEAWKADKEQFSVLAVEIVGTNTDDPEFACRKIVDYFLPHGLFTKQEFTIALEAFKSEVPDNYFEDGLWTLQDSDFTSIQMKSVLQFLVNTPEYQLK